MFDFVNLIYRCEKIKIKKVLVVLYVFKHYEGIANLIKHDLKLFPQREKLFYLAWVFLYNVNINHLDLHLIQVH